MGRFGDRPGFLVSALFAVFALTAAPTVEWLDVGELVASSWDLGVSHPPGQPLPTLIWRLAMLVPLGGIAYRATLVSAACAGLAALPLLILARRLAGPLEERLRPTFQVAVCVAALLGLATWPQAIRAEVYAPQLLLGLGVVAAAMACSGREPVRAVVVMVAVLGLSGATHPLLAVGLVPVACAGLIRSGWATLRRAAIPALVIGVAVTGLFAYLPLRSMARPELAWGMPHTLTNFLAVLSGKAFAHNFTPADGPMFFHNLGVVLGVLFDDVGPALLLLATAGGGALVLARRRWLATVLSLAVVGNLATVLFQNKVFASNPDLHGYLSLSASLLGLLAVHAIFAGLQRLCDSIGGPRTAMAAYGVLGVLLLNAGLVGVRVDRSESWFAEDLMRSQVDGLPPGAVVVTSGNSSTFCGVFGQRVERRRPDLIRFHRTLLGHPFYERQLRSDHGNPPGGIDTAALRADARIALGAGGRTVALEIREPDLAWSSHMRPAGRLMWLSDLPVTLDGLEQHDIGLARWWPDTSQPSFRRDADAVQITLYEGLLRAAYFQQRARPDLVDRELERLRGFADVSRRDLPQPAGDDWWRQR